MKMEISAYFLSLPRTVEERQFLLNQPETAIPIPTTQ
jgi:hypothetical protein